jgi:hypothetical protein
VKKPLATLADLQVFHHHLVKDLAWALLAPPLLLPRNTGAQWLGHAWCQRAWRDYLPRLLQLDADPSPLHTHMQNRKDKRLGSHFESLLEFWLADPANTLYRFVASHVAIRDKLQTIGELDFLVQDKASGQFQHWEVAVKFYLGIRPGGDHANWVGPGLGDRLDLKVSHLLTHQLPLVNHPQTRATLAGLGISQCSSACLLKGRLFYPAGVEQADWQPQAANPDHWTGWWLPATDFTRHFQQAGLDWLPLPREHWLTPLTPDVRIGDTHTASTLLEQLAPGFDNRAVAVVGMQQGHEIERGFLTPPGWPDHPSQKSHT